MLNPENNRKLSIENKKNPLIQPSSRTVSESQKDETASEAPPVVAAVEVRE